MRSVLSGYIRRLGAVLRCVRDQSKASSDHCNAFAERAGASPVMRSTFRMCPEGEPKLSGFQER